jgi:hypothetical protein
MPEAHLITCQNNANYPACIAPHRCPCAQSLCPPSLTTLAAAVSVTVAAAVPAACRPPTFKKISFEELTFGEAPFRVEGEHTAPRCTARCQAAPLYVV